ncbi:hypothetical protein DNU06_00975 [Putridiphycobacter roseus]|uniref:PKD domain-containing protein n=1 Tax=Putridiphycobacter roseus TaxID=2219161 RepID=A0A2W1NUJ9_9FLAO|nr:PKD domain-containing protein [Putridiphycobacter roseus]PZE18438.1 hypothetical protein DNU06_00975 [Putridiphycobacter roseus]
MKSLYLIATLTLTISLTSCKKEDPTALFSTNSELFYIGESVSFTNESDNGLSYYWGFGDGNSSSLKNPSYTYQAVGEYTVTLQTQGAKKTEPKEYSKSISIEERTDILSNTYWKADSVNSLYYNCDGSTSELIFDVDDIFIKFDQDGTALRYNGNYSFKESYTYINDGQLLFTKVGYYIGQLFQFERTETTLKLVYDDRTNCSMDGSNTNIKGTFQTFYYSKK